MHARKHERRAEACGSRRRHVDRHLVRGERAQLVQQGRQLGYRHPRSGAAGIDQLAVVCVIPEQQRSERRARALRIGPADNDEFLAVQKLGLDPDAAVARQVGLVDLLRDHAFDAELRPFLGDARAIADDMTAEYAWWKYSRGRAIPAPWRCPPDGRARWWRRSRAAHARRSKNRAAP